MEAKHTPGPWYVDKECAIWRRPPAELYQNGGGVAGDKPLATVHEGWYGEDVTGYPAQANARLIAAAPDLLEACLKLVEWDDREKDHAISFMARINLCEEAFTAMRAAIAKATQ